MICVRFIYNLRGHQDSYDEYFEEAHILPIQQRLTFKACLLAYKIVRGTAPEYLQELLPRETKIRVPLAFFRAGPPPVFKIFEVFEKKNFKNWKG
eukprot:sb/3479245/